MGKHIHADNMLLFAKDAETMEDPWRYWWWKSETEENWEKMWSIPLWITGKEYKREIPKNYINGIEVPFPETERLKGGDYYFLPCIDKDIFYRMIHWVGDGLDIYRLNNGLVFLNSADATIVAKALWFHRNTNKPDGVDNG